ncbi:MAG TPA: trigger factor [Actinomycetota bacterium]|jgi:trigger factor|nr:trigger factor [Actinomycetota bacterium]
MQTTAERVHKDRVKLRVEVPETALEPALNGVYKRWAGQMKVPGFRKGRVPRQIIDARVGPELIREEALRDALPDLYRDAMAAENLEAIAAPEIEVVEFAPGAPIVFEATVDVRPEIEVPDLSSLTVEAPPADVTDSDVDEQLERLRDRFAELETVPREAREGDHVLIDLKAYRGETLVEEASAPDYLYEVGSRSGPPRLDDELQGNKAGAILKFTARTPLPEGEEELSFTVLVKEVKAKKLPPLDDEFAKTVGEFDDVDALRDELRDRIATLKREMAEEEIRSRALQVLVDASDLDPPESLIEHEFEHRLEHFERDLAAAGLSMSDYESQANITELEMRRDLREGAFRSVKAELLLEQIAREQEFQVTEDDFGRAVAMAAARAGQDPQEVAKNLVESGRLSAVAADIMRRKALDYVVETVNVIGRPGAGDADDRPEPNGGSS